MQVVEKSVLVAHTPEKMFKLVNDVNRYPSFLPWCQDAKIVTQEGNVVTASLSIDYLKVRQHFTTKNHLVPNQSMVMELVEGPFKHLHGEWLFSPVGQIGCKIEFKLHYQFSSLILEKLIGPVFGHISGSLVDAFIKEADRLYDDE